MMVSEHVMKKTPVVIATGFTAAYLGDERSLREFIVGDYLLNSVLKKGENAILYLINDSYDPLNYHQLRIAVNKNEELIAEFRKYCGYPIAEVPDPFDCHASYSEHFIDALVQRLRRLNIPPVVMDTYNAYKAGHYAKYVNIILEKYDCIMESIPKNFDSYSIKNLLRVQCCKCSRLDTTDIIYVKDKNIKYGCKHCNLSHIQHWDEVQGKLSWKLDCAARWQIYNVDLEPFSKAHVHHLGSLAISTFIAKKYFSGKVPNLIEYGMVKMSHDVSYKLLDILPPEMLKQFFIEHISKDIIINRDSVLNFSRKFYIRPGTNFVDFVTQELPFLAIQDEPFMEDKKDYLFTNLELNTLIDFANRYSRFYYNKEYKITFPDAQYIVAGDRQIANAARDFIQYALTLRKKSKNQRRELIKSQIAMYVDNNQYKSKVFPYLRKILGQNDGPTISTLLATLPLDYLKLICMMLNLYIDKSEISLEP